MSYRPAHQQRLVFLFLQGYVVCLHAARPVTVFHCEADVCTSLGNAWWNREAEGGGGLEAVTGSGNWSHYGHHVAP